MYASPLHDSDAGAACVQKAALQSDANDSMQRELFCDSLDRFLERLNLLVTTMAPRGFTAAALGVLAARDARVLFRDPDWLAVQFEMLRAFFAPYSDAPATVTRMTRGLQASLPADDTRCRSRRLTSALHRVSRWTSRACTGPCWRGLTTCLIGLEKA